MIHQDLHKQPQALDRSQHAKLKLKPANTLAAAAQLNAFFLTLVEFSDACKEYPILFVSAGSNDKGEAEVVPVAVFGLAKQENLFWQADNQRWDARYVPAMLRAYPFTLAPVDANQWAVCIDRAWEGWSESDGEALFDADGEPSSFFKDMRGFVEKLEAEIARTRAGCRRLMELKLLAPKRFDATLPDGGKIGVDGFLALDEERWSKLSDAEILELHKSGLAALLQMQQISLTNMTHLVQRRVARGGGVDPAPALAPAANA